MISSNEPTFLTDELIAMRGGYVERLLNLPDEDQKTAIRQTVLVAKDFLQYSEAVRTRVLPVLLNEKPQLEQWGPLIRSNTANPITARFKEFSITFVFGRRPGSMIFQTIVCNFYG